MTKQLRNKIPQIRFRGFDMEWEKKNLGELCEPLAYGLNAAATKYDGENKYLRITDIDDESRTFLKTGLTSPNVNLATSQSYLLQQRDIVFARTGASVGKSYLYKEADGRVFFAGFLIRARVKSDENPDFIFQNTLTEKYDAFVKLTSQRSGQPGINAKEYSSFSFLNPTEISEKNQIGTYFKELDRLIELHQHKHNKLVTLKQAMLQKMFPQDGATTPEIRFKGFEGDWTEIKLGNIGSFHRGISYNASNVCESGLLVLRSSNIQNSKLILNLDLQFINLNCPEEIMLKKGDIVICMSNGSKRLVGKSALCEVNVATPTTVGAFCSIFRSSNKISPYLLQTNKYFKYLNQLLAGSSINNLKNTDLCELVFRVAAEPAEERKVGNYFSTLDKLISQHSTQLDKLKQIKSACLEKMFV